MQLLRRIKYSNLTILLVISVCLFLPGSSLDAKVRGKCSNCHTMHNSQNGTNVIGSNEPYSHLLTNDCIGCHSSSTSSTYYTIYTMPESSCNVPVVFYIGVEPTTYLAGGNFWWVKRGGGFGNDDSKGHNVFFNEADAVLDLNTPGHSPSVDAGCSVTTCHDSLCTPYQGTDYFMVGNLKDRMSCEGCHVVRHHANDHDNGIGGLIDSSDNGWYRFLGHMHQPSPTTDGVRGYEDGDWQATNSSTDHNEYYSTGNPYTSGLNGDISGVCKGCHDQFFAGPMMGIHYLHPAERIIPSSGEYQHVENNTYDPLSPVARNSLLSAPSDIVTPGQDMVMCLSCHFPHGGPYPDMLRWNYDEQLAGSAAIDDKGCFYCHTQKDGS